MQPLSDDEAQRLTQGLMAGDPTALAELYETRFEWMVELVVRGTRRDESFALDCVQDAWMRVARAPVRVDSVAALDAWLRRVALSAALDRIRCDASRVLREARVAAVEVDASIQSIEAARAALHTALAQCAGEERSLLLMRFRAGMTVRQIAAACGLGAASVDSKLRRLLASLRASMEREELQ